MTQWLRAKEAFALLQEAAICKSINYLYAKTKDGTIPCIRQIRSKGYLYNQADIEQFIAAHQVPQVTTSHVKRKKEAVHVYEGSGYTISVVYHAPPVSMYVIAIPEFLFSCSLTSWPQDESSFSSHMTRLPAPIREEVVTYLRSITTIGNNCT